MYCMNCGIEITEENIIDPELEVCKDCFMLEEAIQSDTVDNLYIDDEDLDDLINTLIDIEEEY